jgi:hypothetical protein
MRPRDAENTDACASRDPSGCVRPTRRLLLQRHLRLDALQKPLRVIRILNTSNDEVYSCLGAPRSFSFREIRSRTTSSR